MKQTDNAPNSQSASLALVFPVSVVYAQQLIQEMDSVAFGLGGPGAAVLNALADHTSIEFVYRVTDSKLMIGTLSDCQRLRSHRPADALRQFA